MDYKDFENEIYGNKENKYEDIVVDNGIGVTYESLESIVASKLRGSILWMVFGLILTVLSAFGTLVFLPLSGISYNMFSNILIGSVLLELLVVTVFSVRVYSASVHSLRGMFVLYSLLNGITMSTLAMYYDFTSIVYALFGTIVLFIVMAIYGYTTKEDLTKYNTLLKVGLISLIVMGLLNIFLRSGMLMLISSMLGVVVFIIFIAVDINRIKNNMIYYALEEDVKILDKIAISGALSLYLDFINLFMYILRIIGRKK